MGIGYGKTNYRLRDAIFDAQRYWGEPFPIYYKEESLCNGRSQLPVELPEVGALSSYRKRRTSSCRCQELEN